MHRAASTDWAKVQASFAVRAGMQHAGQIVLAQGGHVGIAAMAVGDPRRGSGSDSRTGEQPHKERRIRYDWVLAA